MLSFLVAISVLTPAPFNFYSYGPYNPAVPKPEAILGYGPGEHETTYFGQQEVVEAIYEHAKDRVIYIRYGSSTEGRPLRVLAISSPENIRRIEQIRRDIRSLASGTPRDAEAIFKSSPAIIWINECIHGDEPAAFESGMWLLYNLAASRSPQIKDLLDKCVVILNPSYNPDGHERFVVWYNSVETGSPNPDAVEQHEPRAIYGRLNHYRFDMNRDRIAMSQFETKEEVAEYLRWNPQVYVDQHGQVSTYFFPPASLSVNANVDRTRYDKWADIFGHAAGDAFDTQGFPYYVKDVFDLYYPGYLDSWTTLNGAIGMTNETDGGFAIESIRADGSTATLRGSMARHFTAAMAYIGSTAAHRETILRDYAQFRSQALTMTHMGPYEYINVHSDDPADIDRLQQQLSSEGISVNRFKDNVTISNAHSLWGGADGPVSFDDCLSIPLAQPQGHLVRALFDPASDFEAAFVKEQLRRRSEAEGERAYPEAEPAEFYDLTAWNPALAANLDIWLSTGPPAPPNIFFLGDRVRKTGTVGYILRPSQESSLAVADLLDAGVHIDVATKELGGTDFQAGSYIIFRDRNGDDLDQSVQEAASKTHALFEALNSSYPIEGRQGAGSESVQPVAKLDIGVFFGDETEPSAYSGIWFALEKTLRLPFTPLRRQALNEDLSKYSILIFPNGQYNPGDKFKDWLNHGGCAIALGPQGWAVNNFAHLEQSKGAELPGSLFRAKLDPRSFLSYGYTTHKGNSDMEIAVPVDGSTFYKAKPEGGGAVVMSDKQDFKKLLSGWEWPNDTEKALEGTVWVHDQQVGNGHLIIFMFDPTDRAMWPGFNKMLLNAILLGSSAGDR